VTQFIGAALKTRNAAVVVATDSHRERLLAGLQAYGLDICAAIEQGRYIAMDAADAISTFIVNDILDTTRFMESFGDLIQKASSVAKGEQPGVAIFGEGAHLLWTRGNAQAALQDERLCNELVKMCDVDILCCYSLGSVEGGMDDHVFPTNLCRALNGSAN
jgi:hypothetical protein